MAKNNSKSNRGKRPTLSNTSPRSYSDLARQSQDLDLVPTLAALPAAEAAKPMRTSDTVNWRGEYGQVFADLRQLLVISAILFTLMLVLGFVL